ncbi:MAG: hypothetical protein WEE89_01035 [Gemmatimonadota bacterium]
MTVAWNVIVLGLSFALTPPARAQEWEVTRRAFTFLDGTLTIDVISEGSGSLQILRGEAGRIEVAARAPRGLPGFALGGREGDELRLTALGAGQVDYLVMVPEDIRVRVRLPERRNVEVPSTRPAANYTWGRQPQRSRLADLAAMTPEGGYYLSYHSRGVPRTLSVDDPGNLALLEVRFGGNDFRLETDRPVAVREGRADHIEYRAGQAGSKLIATLPIDTREFRLVLGGKLALEAKGGEIRSYCEQLVSQRLREGRIIYTYTPSNRLICR